MDVLVFVFNVPLSGLGHMRSDQGLKYHQKGK